MTFGPTDFEEFTGIVYEGDTGEITDWLMEHITDGRDLLKILVTISLMIQGTWPMAITKGYAPSDTQGFALDISNADPADEAKVVSAQILTAALNRDEPAIRGHCRAAVQHGDDLDFAQAVLASLIAIYRMGLRAIVDKAEEQKS